VRLITWNINSVRLRLPLLERLVAETTPDIICLQEIKCTPDLFPLDAVKALGFKYVLIQGQKGYHGVATLSRKPLEALPVTDLNGTGEARYVGCQVRTGGRGRMARCPLFALHNIYVPAGGDIPDRTLNVKFGQKLDFYSGLTAWSATLAGTLAVPSILVGDLNVAPLEHDVWSHKQLLKVVSHTPIEVEHFDRFTAAHGWHDAMRAHIPAEQKLYTWWSYRAADWRLSNRGRRLDHVLTSPQLAGAVRRISVLAEVRGWDRASDHVPVIADLEL
jgi:exodeoxyribonuclease III